MFLDPNEAMIEQQARIITTLRADLVRAQRAYEESVNQYNEFNKVIAANQEAGLFYKQLQNAIMDNPILQTEWTRFVMFLKMVDFEKYKKKKKPANLAPAEAADDTNVAFMDLKNKPVPFERQRMRNV